jgi:hypothetical protein
MDETEKRLEELKLVIESKHNVNNLLMQTMMVFYAIVGGLLAAILAIDKNAISFVVAVFSAIILFLFFFIVRRLESTNNKCDLRALELEKELQMKVVANYQPSTVDGFLDKVRMHRAIEVVTLAIAVLCCGVAVIYNPWYRLF